MTLFDACMGLAESLGPKAPYMLCAFFLTAVPNFRRAGGTSALASVSMLNSSPESVLSYLVKKSVTYTSLTPSARSSYSVNVVFNS